LVDADFGAAIAAVAAVCVKRSSAAAPAVGIEKFVYVWKLDAVPVTLKAVPRQPVRSVVAVVGHSTASPIVPALAPEAVHCATVTSEQAEEPGSDVVPAGQGNCVAATVPIGQ
jgi:hypothetical protein